MPDNWNKLANLLGTPSIDPIERKPAPPKNIAKTAEPEAIEAKNPVAEPNVAPATTAQNDLPPVSAATEPAAESKSKFKSTWDAVAEFFGVATPEPVEPSPASAPANLRAESTSTISSNATSNVNRPSAAVKKSFWGIEEEAESSSERSPQQVSDELLGRKPSQPTAEDDLEKLLAGFNARPAEKQEPAASDRPPAAGVDRTSRSPSPASRSQEDRPRRERPNDRPASDRPPTSRRRSSSELPDDQVSVSETLAEDASRGRRRVRSESDDARRVSAPDADVGMDGTPQRRGPRRRPRRELIEGSDAAAREVQRTDDDIEIIDEQLEEVGEDSTIDTTRRGGRRWSSDRNSRGTGGRRAASRDATEPRTSREPRPDREPRTEREPRGERDSRVEREPRGEREVRDGRRARPELEPRLSREDRPTREARPARDPRPAAPRAEERPRAKTSAWDDPQLVDEIAFIDNDTPAEEGLLDDEGNPRRRRRRRRRSRGEADVPEGDDIAASTGRQIYGRHADEAEDGLEEVEALQASNVIPWVDAISVIVDKNMKNHRHAPPHNPRHRGGPRGGSGNDRRR